MPDSAFPKVSDSTTARQAHILAATTRIIARKGFAGLTMRAVAEEAGCSRGLVEHYFSNKASLVAGANDWANTTYLDRVASSVGGSRGLAALEIRLRELLPYDERTLDEWRVRVAFWQETRSHPHLQGDTQESLYAVYEQMFSDMRHAQQCGEMADMVPVQVTSEMVFIMIVGMATICLNDARLRQHEALNRRVAMIMGMLKSGDLSALQVGNPEEDY